MPATNDPPSTILPFPADSSPSSLRSTFSFSPSFSANDPRLATALVTPIQNIHPVVTRSKNEVFKPKMLLTEYTEVEPPFVKEALRCPHWTTAMIEEYIALLRNQT